LLLRVGEYKFGLSKIVLSDEGVLSVLDPYISKEFYIGKDVEVSVTPLVPKNVPKELSGSLYIKLDKSILVKNPLSIWIEAPYELLVEAGGAQLAIISPFKVKYILFGDVVEGEICRYHESRVYYSKPDLGWKAAYIKILVRELESPLNFIYIPLDKVDIHEEEDELYYDPLILSSDDGEIVVKPVTSKHKILSSENIGRFWDELVGGWRYIP